MSYEKAVKDAAAALVRGEDANWELARLTYENANTRRGGVTYETWSKDVRDRSGRRFASETARKFANMWDRFGTIVPIPGWTESWYELTPRDAAEPMRARAAKTHVGEGNPTEVAALVHEALKRPEVAKAVVADRTSNLTLAKARNEHDREVLDIAEVNTPALGGARRISEQATAEHDLIRMARDLDAIADQADGWGDRADGLTEAAAMVATKAQHLSDKLSGAFDDAVSALLGDK